MRIRRKFDLYQHLPLFAKHDDIICAKCDDKLLLLHRMPAKFQVAKRVKDRADEEEAGHNTQYFLFLPITKLCGSVKAVHFVHAGKVRHLQRKYGAQSTSNRPDLKVK